MERTVGGGPGILLGALIILGVAALAFLPGLGDRDFWPQDEARYGTVALEMWQGAHPAVPKLNGRIYQDKPPGYFWLVNAAALIRGGVDEWAARLPSAFGATLLALGAYFMLAQAGGWTAGLVAGLIALASWLLMWEARQARLDALFGGLIALGMAAMARALEPGRERFTFIGLLMIGFAVLVKGPLALVAVLTFAVGAILVRRPRAFFNAALLPGLLMVILPSALWLGWAYFHLNGIDDGSGLEYVRALFRDEIGERITTARAHQEPWHYYLAELPPVLLPFLPIALLGIVPPIVRSLGPMRPAFGIAACWFVLGFAIQSAFPGRRVIYMLPLVAPFAVVCGAVVHATTRASVAFSSGWAALVGCVLFIAGGAAVVSGVDDALFADVRRFAETRISETLCEHERKNSESRSMNACAADPVVRERIAALDWDAIRKGALIAGIAALVLSSIALTALALGALRPGIAWTAVSVAVPVGLALGFVLPPFDVLISRRPVVEAAVASAGGPQAAIGYLRHLDEAFPYYAGRPITELFESGPARTDDEKRRFRKAADDFLSQRGAVLVVRPDDFRELRLAELSRGPVVGPLRAGSKQFFLLRGPR